MLVERYAHIKNGVVVNVTLWDGDISRWQPPEDELVITAPENVGIGWRYDGTDWLEPLPPPVVDAPEEVPPAV